jgi:hypothetical protein
VVPAELPAPASLPSPSFVLANHFGLRSPIDHEEEEEEEEEEEKSRRDAEQISPIDKFYQ